MTKRVSTTSYNAQDVPRGRFIIIMTPNWLCCLPCGNALAVVLDLFSRRVIGWAMQPRMERDLVIKALLMAVWRRKPVEKVIIHSDQGSQFTSHEWQSFLKANNLECSMSRRGNCHDNAVAESFFQLLKRERMKRRIYPNREEARSDIFDYIEIFYNTRR